MRKNFLYLLSAIMILASCSKSSSSSGNNNSGGSASCAGVPNKFAADVNPIIQSTCATNASCHGSGSSNGPGPLLTYTAIFNARISIKTAVSNGTMPKTGSLTAAQKSSIICWIDDGAQNN
jgi:hypothetical protein